MASCKLSPAAADALLLPPALPCPQVRQRAAGRRVSGAGGAGAVGRQVWRHALRRHHRWASLLLLLLLSHGAIRRCRMRTPRLAGSPAALHMLVDTCSCQTPSLRLVKAASHQSATKLTDPCPTRLLLLLPQLRLPSCRATALPAEALDSSPRPHPTHQRHPPAGGAPVHQKPKCVEPPYNSSNKNSNSMAPPAHPYSTSERHPPPKCSRSAAHTPRACQPPNLPAETTTQPLDFDAPQDPPPRPHTCASCTAALFIYPCTSSA